VVELMSNTIEDLDDNVERVSLWVKKWKKDHKEMDGDYEEEGEANGK
jgi:hypothetical protein